MTVQERVVASFHWWRITHVSVSDIAKKWNL